MHTRRQRLSLEEGGMAYLPKVPYSNQARLRSAGRASGEKENRRRRVWAFLPPRPCPIINGRRVDSQRSGRGFGGGR